MASGGSSVLSGRGRSLYALISAPGSIQLFSFQFLRFPFYFPMKPFSICVVAAAFLTLTPFVSARAENPGRSRAAGRARSRPSVSEEQRGRNHTRGHGRLRVNRLARRVNGASMEETLIGAEHAISGERTRLAARAVIPVARYGELVCSGRFTRGRKLLSRICFDRGTSGWRSAFCRQLKVPSDRFG